MEHTKHFQTNIFGGFKKENVLDFIDETMKEYVLQNKSLSAQLEQSEQDRGSLQLQLEEAQLRLRQALVQIHNLRNKVKVNEENYQAVVEEKNGKMDELELKNRQLSYKVQALEDRIKTYGNMEQEQQNKISLAEKTAREKTDMIIKQAKQIVEEEYNYRLEQAEHESHDLIRRAQTQAAEIVENAADRAQNILTTSKQDLEAAVMDAHKRSSCIIQQAQARAQNILTGANKAISTQTNMPQTQSIEQAKNRTISNLDQMKEKIEKEVTEAVRCLDQATSSVKTARDKVAKIQMVKPIPKEEKSKYKKAIHNFFD